MNRRQTAATRAITLAYMVALSVLMQWPRLDVAALMHTTNDSVPLGLDKLCHLGAFAALALLACLCRVGERRLGRAHHLLAVALVVVFAGVNELAQHGVAGRSVSGRDMLANCGGLAIGWACYLVLRWLGGDGRSSAGGFAVHTRLVSGLTLVSRFLGLGRDWALGVAIGFGAIADSFWIAFIIPNLFRRLFGDGALAAAFIPHYAALNEKSPATARRFATQIVRRLALVLLALTAAAGVVIAIVAAMMPAASRGLLAAELATVTIWYMPLVCVAAILGAVLQVHRRFVVPAASPVVLNVFIIGAALAAATFLSDWPLRSRVALLAVAVVAAGVVQLIWHALAVADAADGWTPLRLRADSAAADPDARHAHRKLLAQWAPTVIGLAVFQVNVLADSLIAMAFSGQRGSPIGWLGGAVDYPMQVGAVSILSSAARLYEFPLGVFGIALATAIFPQLAGAAARRADFSSLVRQGLRLAVYIGLPASVGLLLVRYPLTRAIYFPGGQVTHEDAARIAWVLAGYAPAVWAYSMNHVLTRAFYAQHDAATPMRIALGIVALNVTLNLVLIWPLGAAGLAWSTAICAIVQCALLARGLRRYCDAPVDRGVVGGWVRTAALSAVMALAVWASLAPFDLPALSRGGVALALLGGTAVGAAVFLVGSRAMGMIELRWLTARA